MIDRLYAALLLAFPRRFRTRYGDAMRRIFRERHDRAASEGRTAVAAFLARNAIDVLINATLERAAAVRQWFLLPQCHERLAAGEQEQRPMLWQALTMDVRYAVRMFLHAPAFTALAVAALALGIGANSAIFTVVNSVLLRPLPYADPDRLVMIWSVNEAQSAPPSAMSEGDVIDIRRASTLMARLEAFQANLVPVNFRLGVDAMSAQAVAVTPNTFNFLGREALLGRALRAGDRFIIVLSHGYWQRQFGADPAIVGRQVTVGNQPATIVGVMPPDFAFPYPSMLRAPISFSRAGDDVDLWVPMTVREAGRPAGGELRLLGVVGRLKSGITVEQARAEMDALGRQLAREHPDTNAGWTATALDAHEQTVSVVRPALLLLLAGVALVLLMACVNVANLLVTRSLRRQREMAVRAALGAGRGRLLRQALTESLLLSLLGAAAAWLVLRSAIRGFVAIAPGEIPRLAEIAPDWRVVAYTGAIALATGVGAGLLPALTASRVDVQRRLADAARGTTGRSGRRVRSVLVIAEIALALVLTVGAGLLVRSFLAVLSVDPGFRTENLLTMQVNVPRRYDTPDKRRDFYRQLFARLEAIPGVMTVGGTTRLPLGGANSSTTIAVEGRDTSRGLVDVGLRRAMHDYFATMGMPIVRGRGFDPRDGPNAPAVVVINETMARRVFPGEEPIGRRVTLGDNAGIGLATIVGIVGDVRHEGLEATPAPEIYIHYLQNPPTAPLVVMRTTGDPAALTAEVRAAAREVDPTLAPFDFRTMADLRFQSMSQRKFITLLAAMFGVLALTMAAVGVYGVMALVTTERTQEIGVRMALGAEPGQVLRLVVGHGLGMAAIGVAIGGLASLALTPMMASQLYGVGALDPITLGGIPALLLGVALIACVVPARRAMRVDPVAALRAD